MAERFRDVHVETGVGMAYDAGCAVWSFDPDLWGTCAQGQTVDEALQVFATLHGSAQIVEMIHGDERAFVRDRVPATDEELVLTLGILATQRLRAIELLAQVPADLLDFDDPGRDMPEWATWRSIRGRFWHICDTESRYYLPSCGLPARDREASLERELAESASHVRSVLSTMPRNLEVHTGTQEWTSTKLVRRLAWHEAGELDVIERLLAN